MPRLTHERRIVSPFSPRTQAPTPFGGFAAPTSNTTYTPNQFFDVCLPHSSRGVVRLVAYLIRKSLGWCDSEGNPREEQIVVSYHDLVTRAGISRDQVRQALDEAIASHFIECVEVGQANAPGQSGHSARFQLRWDPSPEYRKRPSEFRGFFEGDGNRTDIPNQFFDVVVPSEPLSVIKVVGAIVRFSIGFQAKHGRRRQQATLSYQEILNYARIASRDVLAQAIRTALEHQYIVRLEAGVFSPEATARRPAVYALHWADGWNGQKSVPGVKASENRTSNGPISVPAERSENRTNIQTKPLNDTGKQQAVAARDQAREILKNAGFGDAAAADLAGRVPLDVIERQVRWLDQREPTKNRFGLLRRALEEDWSEPTEVRTSELSGKAGFVFAQHFYAAFAGNQAEPVNEPSARDTETAESLLRRLQAVQPDASPAETGRALGHMARGQRNPFPSLQVAIRQLGDQLLVMLQNGQKRLERQTLEAEREAHLATAVPAYQAFLRREEERLQEKQPDEYGAFVTGRAEERERLARHPLWSRSSRFLETFDAESRRLSDLQRHFHLPDFATWDSAHYPTHPKP